MAAQAATGAVRYDISFDPVKGRWYLDASWRAAPAPAVPLAELRAAPALQRDGRVRAAISELIRIAKEHGCRAMAIEDLDFAQAPTAPTATHATRNGGTRQAPRQPPPRWRKTQQAHRHKPPDQATHDRSGPPTEPCVLPLSD